MADADTPSPRQGWSEDAKRLAAAGDDALAWPAFANDGDHDRVWGASDEQSDKALSPRASEAQTRDPS
jgi:hypothetical protein